MTPRKLLFGFGAVTLSLGAVAMFGASAASAKGGPPPGKGPSPAGNASGTVTCAVKAVMVFNPPLQSTATGTSMVTLNAQLVKCTTTSTMRRTTGHINQASLGTIATNTCTAPTAPSFSMVAVRWTPPSRVAGSTLSDTSPGTEMTTTGGNAQVSYTGVTATGSFATTTGALTLTSRDTAANLTAECTGAGLDAIAFGGVATGL